MSARVMTEAMWITGLACPMCHEELVNSTIQADEYPVVSCTSKQCFRPFGSGEYYAVVDGALVPYCVGCNRLARECTCTRKDGEHHD